MTTNTNTAFTNPRLHAIIPDWPCGRHRVTATFTVENGRGGTKQRVSRTTTHPVTNRTNAPKRSTYAVYCCIVDGDDDLTYTLHLTHYGHITVMRGTMKEAYTVQQDNSDYYYHSLLQLIVDAQNTEEPMPCLLN